MPDAQLDLFKARRARDAGMARVAAKNDSWLERAIDLASRVVQEGETTGELIRLRLLRSGLAAPSNPNAWGALVRTMVARGFLIDSGRSTHATDVKSHACRVPVWLMRRRG